MLSFFPKKVVNIKLYNFFYVFCFRGLHLNV